MTEIKNSCNTDFFKSWYILKFLFSSQKIKFDLKFIKKNEELLIINYK